MSYKNLVITPPKPSNLDSVKESQFYRGFSTLVDDSSVTLYDNALVKQDLINQFNTKKGERVMNPEFGTIIWNLLFDPLTDSLKQEIQDDVNRILALDPRISPLSATLVEKEYGILIDVEAYYVNTDQTENIKLAFDKELGLIAQ